MTKLIVVLGATGGQGGSVVNTFLSTPGWRVRANTDDQRSLMRAFAGAYAIFAFTDYYDYFFELWPDKSIARETAQGTNIARAATKIASLERFVWSTLPNTERFTQGAAVVPLQGKANVDVFIKSELPELYKKTAFVREAGIDMYNVPDFPVVRAQDLMSEEAKAALVPTEESLARMDWSSFFSAQKTRL
ncbi:hypothetical protein BJY01DRAFT_256090 [Aspergillus pseudoustus]|uniref:NmrA-like domain-containing protein n=1 Tax=Aspergillus pseudoustus TaxID=1810923 RepID=A0ABR4IH00_9EURO